MMFNAANPVPDDNQLLLLAFLLFLMPQMKENE